jgi:hypothetical protein
MGRAAAVLVAAVAACGIGLGACGALVGAAAGIGGPAAAPAPTGGGGAHTRTPAVPAAWEVLDRAAAATCPGLDWTLLAAIGRVESDSGRSTAPGVWSGANPAGAEVIYRWDGGLWHLSREVTGGRGSLVSEGSLARGQGGGHSGFIGSPAHDDQISSVASGVSI